MFSFRVHPNQMLSPLKFLWVDWTSFNTYFVKSTLTLWPRSVDCLSLSTRLKMRASCWSGGECDWMLGYVSTAMPGHQGASNSAQENQWFSSMESQVRILVTIASVAFPFSRGSSQSRDRTQVSLHCRQILYQLSHKRSPIVEWSQASWSLKVVSICGKWGL